MKKIIKKVNGVIKIVQTGKRSNKSFLKAKNKNNEYFEVELPEAKYPFYKSTNTKNNFPVKDRDGNVVFYIEVDKERELQEIVKRKKAQIKSLKKQNQNEDIKFQGHIFKGGLSQIDKYEKSRDLALALGLDKGNFFDKNDFPVEVDLDEANTLLRTLGVKIYKCKAQESAIAVQIQAILDNSDLLDTEKIEQVETIEWIHIDIE